MLRSMYAGISGMKANQTKLDVVGNNVSNAGTTAFKSSRVRFQDMLSQTQNSASAPSRSLGGVNPGQVGLGVSVGGIDRIMTQGMMQPTGRNLDVAMDGPSFFVVGRGSLPLNNASGVMLDSNEGTIISGNGMSVNFTRDGALALDQEGNLVTSEGYRVLGYAIREKDGNNKNTVSVDYSKNGECSFVNADSKYGLVAEETLVPLRIPDTVFVKAAEVKDSEMDFTGKGEIAKIKTNPKLTLAPEKYTGKTDMKVEIKYVADDKGDYHAKTYISGNVVSSVAANSANAAINFEKKTEDQIKALTGEAKTIAENINKVIEQLGLPDKGTTLNIQLAQYEGTAPTGKDLEKFSFGSTLSAEGDKKVKTFNIEKDGTLKAVLEDGKVSVLGQLAMASFKNPEGLESLGKNMYQNTSNSGQAVIRGGIGSVNSSGDGFGNMLQGVLEMSNVDIAEQFTDMIVANRAFQASSKMISNGDEILQEIINLKR